MLNSTVSVQGGRGMTEERSCLKLYRSGLHRAASLKAGLRLGCPGKLNRKLASI